uniref:Uncharacterized protein n=1 Tax=Salix viminalis TaxID=40686 RepID=A0A6N2NGT7_SALVM
MESHLMHLLSKLEHWLCCLEISAPCIGLCNGARLIITQLSLKVIETQIITGSNIDNKVFITRISFPFNEIKMSFYKPTCKTSIADYDLH